MLKPDEVEVEIQEVQCNRKINKQTNINEMKRIVVVVIVVASLEMRLCKLYYMNEMAFCLRVF